MARNPRSGRPQQGARRTDASGMAICEVTTCVSRKGAGIGAPEKIEVKVRNFLFRGRPHSSGVSSRSTAVLATTNQSILQLDLCFLVPACLKGKF